jgi:hypothetical protein
VWGHIVAPRVWTLGDFDIVSSLVRNLLDGQYESPVRIIAFNTAKGWSRDVTVDIADELRRRYVEYDEVPESVLKFLEATNRR